MVPEGQTSIFKDKTIRTGIIAGLISSAIFFIFLQSIFEFLSKLFLKLGSTFFEGLINSVYFRAASAAYNDIYGGLTASIILGITLGVLHNGTYILKYLEKKNNLINERSVVGHTAKLIFLKIFPFYIILFSVFLLYVGVQANVVSESYSIFMQRITAITPYTTDDQIKKINSMWVLMKGKSDYIEVNKVIDEIAGLSKLDIPKPY